MVGAKTSLAYFIGPSFISKNEQIQFELSRIDSRAIFFTGNDQGRSHLTIIAVVISHDVVKKH